jgi:hypothetical protein
MHIFGHKYRWQIPSVDEQQAHALASRYNLSAPVMRTLLARGYAEQPALDEFLFSSFEKDVAIFEGGMRRAFLEICYLNKMRVG